MPKYVKTTQNFCQFYQNSKDFIEMRTHDTFLHWSKTHPLLSDPRSWIFVDEVGGSLTMTTTTTTTIPPRRTTTCTRLMRKGNSGEWNMVRPSRSSARNRCALTFSWIFSFLASANRYSVCRSLQALSNIHCNGVVSLIIVDVVSIRPSTCHTRFIDYCIDRSARIVYDIMWYRKTFVRCAMSL